MEKHNYLYRWVSQDSKSWHGLRVAFFRPRHRAWWPSAKAEGTPCARPSKLIELHTKYVRVGATLHRGGRGGNGNASPL